MKRILCTILIICLLVTMLAACTPSDGGVVTTEPPTTINVGVLNGPTAMGALKLWADNDTRYEFTLYTSPDQIMPDLQSGAIDVAALPTNNAAELYNAGGKKLQVLALNTLGVLHLLDTTGAVTSLADLEGKTIYVPNAGSNPEYIVRHLLAKNGINATVETSIVQPALIQQGIVSGSIGIAVLPQPAATATALSAKGAGKTVTSIDLSSEWAKIESTPIAQGCLVASRNFIEKHPTAIANFLTAYEASVAYMTAAENLDAAAALIVEKGILPKAPVAKQALPKCAISYVDGAEMKAALDAFYAILSSYNSASIGGAIPDDGFYYTSK